MRKLQERNLYIRPEKCEWHKKEVTFLGFIVGINGLRIDPDKIKSVKEWPTPTTIKQVQAFLGFANYNRKFIKNYSALAQPLIKLTRKDQSFEWTQEQQTAFQKLKEASVQAPTLKMFDEGKPIQIETDASDLAIGACLTQEHEGQRHPVAYFSRKLTPAEQNYDIHDKELLAIVAALRHWRVYAEGAPALTVFSDHKNLPSGLQIRYSVNFTNRHGNSQRELAMEDDALQRTTLLRLCHLQASE